MTFWKSLILGLLQGLTEFLPISSSGHLVLGQKFFNLKPPIFFDILVHFGTLLAVVFYFSKDFKRLKSFKILRLLFVASLPAGIVGVLLRENLEQIFSSYSLLGFSFLITAGLLISTKFLKKQEKEIEGISLREVFLIGCFQALALLPGISRSGATIMAGLLIGLKRKEAFYFSFFLSIPAVAGALFLELVKTSFQRQNNIAIVGMVMAFLSGFLALKILEKIILKKKLFYFGFYCAILGILILFLNFNL